MPDEKLPLLRGRIEITEHFRSTRGGGGKKLVLSRPDRGEHRDELLRQLDALEAEVETRPTDARDADAAREVIAVEPAADVDFPADSLGDARGDVRVVGVDPDTKTVILDAPGPQLAALRRKIDAYADEAKSTRSGQPLHAPLVAGMETISRATLEDLGDEQVRALTSARSHWFEVACRGGRYYPEEAPRSRGQIERQLERVAPDSAIAAQFTAPSQTVFYVKLTVDQLRALIDRVDCIHEIHLAERRVRDWLLLELDEAELTGHAMTPPAPDAPSVVLLDTGVKRDHPLLQSAIISAESVVPGVTSGIDVDGHGTQMAGVALHLDGVGDAVQNGRSVASHWLQTVKLLSSESRSSDESARATWAPMTEAAVDRAEAHQPTRRRVFAMAVTAPIAPVAPTNWSQAVEQIAYADGRGRVFCISAGNADSARVNLIQQYPDLNLVEPIQDPAQAWNALTIGAVTFRDRLPPEDDYAAYEAVAPVGGISPHSSSRPATAENVPNKPDVVFEGGNVAFDGSLPNPTVGTLIALTTGHAANRPLAGLWATSEATARAAHLAAAIWEADPALRPETVRGLVVHAASWTDAMNEQFPGKDDRLSICGYGVPDPAFATHCVRERATIVVEDEMPNAIMVERPRKTPPKRAGTPPFVLRPQRIAKFFRLPIDEDTLLEHEGDVELRVTLSYFAEVVTSRRRSIRGLDLCWDMQGPGESPEAFQWRVNKLVREDATTTHSGKSFQWNIGFNHRRRGTVQSDRWTGPAGLLAGNGDRLIAVMPVGGWWANHVELREKTLAFSLIVSLRAAGLDVYTPIAVALETAIDVEV